MKTNATILIKATIAAVLLLGTVACAPAQPGMVNYSYIPQTTTFDASHSVAPGIESF